MTRNSLWTRSLGASVHSPAFCLPTHQLPNCPGLPPKSQVPQAKMAEGYQHPAIELTVLKRRKDASLENLEALEAAEAAAAAADPASADKAVENTPLVAAAAAAVATAAAAASDAAAGEPVEAKPSQAAETGPAAAAAASHGGAENGRQSSSLAAGEQPSSRDGEGAPTGVAGVHSTASQAAPTSAATTLAGQLAATSLGAAGARPLMFEERRAGAMAARLLANVHVPPPADPLGGKSN